MRSRAPKTGRRPCIGISACLLGRCVRYDGGHKLDPALCRSLRRSLRLVPVCPEVECGLPVPRESMRLVGDPGDPRLITVRSRVDHTRRMKRWAAHRLDELEELGLCGFIFKANSPSCGVKRVRVYGARGAPSRKGVGLWACAVMRRFPLLPVEEEAGLLDRVQRERFILRLASAQRRSVGSASRSTSQTGRP